MNKNFIPVSWKPQPTLQLTQREFDDLPEYSCTFPTGQTIGKRWKRDRNFGNRSKTVGPVWDVAEYVEHEDPKLVGIRWYEPEILQTKGVSRGINDNRDS